MQLDVYLPLPVFKGNEFMVAKVLYVFCSNTLVIQEMFIARCYSIEQWEKCMGYSITFISALC